MKGNKMTKELKSINMKDVFDKKKVKDNLNKPLVEIYGVAHAVGYYDGKYGETPFLKGDFQALNLLTGEVFEAKALFLSNTFMTDAVKAFQNNDSIETEIKIEVSATESDKNASGFAWVFEIPMSQERMNQKAKIATAVQARLQELKLLSAPVEKTKKSA